MTSSERRFWAKVIALRPGDCWIWKGATAGLEGKEYGNFWLGQQDRPYIRAHIFSWQLANGPVPPGLWVLHRCDVRLCVNPRHLFLGTVIDNNRDTMLKDRVQFGRRHWNAKLQEDDIALITERRRGGEPLAAIAADYGIAVSNVSGIAKGTRWRRAPRGFDPRREYDALCDAVRAGLVHLEYWQRALRGESA